MMIRSVEFAGAIAAPGQPFPSPLPQIAFAGRSNVGKSSLINRLLGRPRRRIARVSASPGKTRELNFYRVNGSFCLVDLPGSGFARVPARVREEWRVLVRWYLAESAPLRGVVYLVDARHPPKDGDREFMDRLAEVAVPTLIALTKVDKLRPSVRERGETAARAARSLGVDEDQVVESSARTGEGAAALLEAMEALLALPARRAGAGRAEGKP